MGKICVYEAKGPAIWLLFLILKGIPVQKTSLLIAEEKA